MQQVIGVYSLQRALGKTVAGADNLGLIEDNLFYKQVDDMHIMMLHRKAEWPQQKIFLLGNSLGSFLCKRYFQMYGNTIDGLILSATNGKKDPLMGMDILLA